LKCMRNWIKCSAMKRLIALAMLAAACSSPAPQPAAAPPTSPAPPVPSEPLTFGKHHHPIRTSNVVGARRDAPWSIVRPSRSDGHRTPSNDFAADAAGQRAAADIERPRLRGVSDPHANRRRGASRRARHGASGRSIPPANPVNSHPPWRIRHPRRPRPPRTPRKIHRTWRPVTCTAPRRRRCTSAS
jgi:hypothetical protein